MCRFEAQITGDRYSFVKICNHEAVHFNPKMHVYE
jgi:hypothetical protein